VSHALLSAAPPEFDSAAPPTLRQRKHELVRSAIWEAATDLFAEKGYDETTVDEIADRAGLSRRSFFRYFSSKTDLMASGLVEYGRSIDQAVRACPADSPFAETVRRTALQVALEVTAHPGSRKIMRIVGADPAAREALRSRTAELREVVRTAYASRGAAIGDLAPGLLADLTLAILDVVLHDWLEKGGQDIRASVDEVFATLRSMTGA
jgi:AcrR family transcriptional regulator